MEYYTIIYPFENEGVHRCDICYGVPNNGRQGQYNDLDKYIQHVRRVHKKKPQYQCSECDEIYFNKRTVKSHYSSRHEREDENQAEDHIRELQDITNEIAELRAEVGREIDLSRVQLVPDQTELITSTPVVRQGVARPNNEAEISTLLDRLSAAVAHGDAEEWDNALQDNMQRRRRHSSISYGEETNLSLGGGVQVEGNEQVNSVIATEGDLGDVGNGEGPPDEGLAEERSNRWLQDIADAQSFDDFQIVVRNWTLHAAPQERRRGSMVGGAGTGQGRGRGRGGDRGREQRPGRGGGRGRGPARARLDREGYDPHEAARIQKLYRKNRKKALNQVLGGESRFCKVDGPVIEDHFRGVFSAGNSEVGDMPEVVRDVMTNHVPGPDDDDLVRDITPGEVMARLGRAANTAPGPDGVPYWALKRADPGAVVLAAIFNRCLAEGRTPTDWKSSNTVLIHKKGDPQDLDNWRPLALASCISKLYTGLLASRIGKWAKNGKISWPQKGFMEHEGCFEHNLVVRSAIEDARRGGKRVTLAWLDLSNAFGSVPHSYLVHALRLHGMPDKIVGVVSELYHDAVTKVRTSQGYTNPIPLAAGVKQGDPLSPILFNLAMEPVVRAVYRSANTDGYRLGERHFSIVAYADDLALIASGEEQMRRLLKTTEEVAAWAGLRFNAKKCASLDVDCRGRRRVLATQFEIGGAPMMCLKEGEEYCHLGVPTGFKVNQTPEQDIAQMATDIKKIDESLLAPWQKLEAVRMFVLPRLDFIMRGARVAKTPLKKLDGDLKRRVKGWLYLPQRASAEVVYLGVAEGGAGMFPLADLVDISSVVHAFRMITCADPVVKDLARATLFHVTKKRLGRPVSPDEVADYLSGRVDGDFARDGGDIGSLWTDARNAAGRLQKKIGVHWKFDELRGEFQVCIPMPGSRMDPVAVPEDARKHLFMRLKKAIRMNLRRSLLRKPDQGKVIDVACRCRDSNHFIQAGKFTRFADWRFIFRARLGTVPLNGCRRWGQGDRRCRRCGEQSETLPHVLNHCQPNSDGWRRRHDAVLHRLAEAIPDETGTIRVDLTVPGTTSTLRPDLVITNERSKRIHLVDVAIPFENRYGALAESRAQKTEKYEQLAEQLRLKGYEVSLDGFIVGALGSWDMANERVIKQLGISSRYAQTMKRLMVSDVIRWSRDIYVTHITGHRQWQ